MLYFETNISILMSVLFYDKKCGSVWMLLIYDRFKLNMKWLSCIILKSGTDCEIKLSTISFFLNSVVTNFLLLITHPKRFQCFNGTEKISKQTDNT